MQKKNLKLPGIFLRSLFILPGIVNRQSRLLPINYRLFHWLECEHRNQAKTNVILLQKIPKTYRNTDGMSTSI